jgi:nitrite reductase/ring-hydroxylating ferredoxin subunit
MKLLIVNGRRIVLAKTARGFTAFDDRCTHRGGSLADGACVGGVVQCLWHGSQFDTTTGQVKCGPARERIGVYEVRQQRGDVVLVSSPE